MTGDEMRAVRTKIGLSQAEFGKKLGLSRVYVGLMERGNRKISTQTALAARTIKPKSINRPVTQFENTKIAVEKALLQSGVEFKTNAEVNNIAYDFYIADLDICIELKKNWSRSSAGQLVNCENIILVQGVKAIAQFCKMLISSDLSEIDDAERWLYKFGQN